MYKFTNGIVVFDEKTRDEYLKAGYKLVEDKTIVNDKPELVLPKKLTQDLENQLNEVLDENASNNRTIKEQSKKCNKLSK